MRKIIIFLLPVVILAVVSWIRWTNYNLFEVLGFEDGFFEYWQAGFLLITCGFAFAITWKLIATPACRQAGRPFSRNDRARLRFVAVIYFLLAIACFFVAMEEVSWAQRIVGLETGGFFQENLQQETNFHNLPLIHDRVGFAYLAIMFYGMFGWVVARLLRRKAPRNDTVVPLFVFPWYLMLYFHRLWINLDFSNYAPQDFEVAEFLLYLGVLIFVIDNYLRVRRIVYK